MNTEENSSGRYHEGDYQTVEFEIEHFPAPLQWDSWEGVVRWARPPQLSEELASKWDVVLKEIQQRIRLRAGEYSHGHEVTRALRNRGHSQPNDPLMMYHIKSLQKIFPMGFLAKRRVVVSEPQCVKHHIVRRKLPPGWNF
jgi:hypothetical protein